MSKLNEPNLAVFCAPCLTFTSVYVGGRAEGVGVPPRRGALQVVSRQTEPLRGQVKAWKVEIPHLGERESSIKGRLGGSQRGLGFGRLAITVQQVFNEEWRLLGRGARLLRRLWHRGGSGVSAEERGNGTSGRGKTQNTLTYTPTDGILAVEFPLPYSVSVTLSGGE